MEYQDPQYGIFFPGIPSISTASERVRLATLDKQLFQEPLGITLAGQAVSELSKYSDNQVTIEGLTDAARLNSLAPDRLDEYEHVRHLLRGVVGYRQFISGLSRKLTNQNCNTAPVLVCPRSMGLLAALVVSESICFESAVYLAQVMGRIHRESYDRAESKYVSRKLYRVTDRQLSGIKEYLSNCDSFDEPAFFVLEHNPDWSTLIQYSDAVSGLMESALDQLGIQGSRPSYFSSGAHTPLTWNRAHELQRVVSIDVTINSPTSSFQLHAQSAKQAHKVLYSPAEIRDEVIQVTCGPMDLRPMLSAVTELAVRNPCFVLVEVGSNTLASQLEALNGSSIKGFTRVYDPYYPECSWISDFVNCVENLSQGRKVRL